MSRRIAIKLLNLAGANLAGTNWPRPTYCPPWFLIVRASRVLAGDARYGDMAGAWLSTLEVSR